MTRNAPSLVQSLLGGLLRIALVSVALVSVAGRQVSADTAGLELSGASASSPTESHSAQPPAAPSSTEGRLLGLMARSAVKPIAELNLETVKFLSENEIRRGSADSGTVALTFDCGFGRAQTEAILDTLIRHEAHATFFLEGSFVDAYPPLVARMMREGHEIGSHSMTHPDFTSLDQDAVAQELTPLADQLDVIAQQEEEYEWNPTRLFRFPYGKRDADRLRMVAKLVYQSVSWSIDPQGWRDGATAAEVGAGVLSAARAGDIVLQHCNSQADVDALATIIEGLRERGLSVGSIASILQTAGGAPAAGRQSALDPEASSGS